VAEGVSLMLNNASFILAGKERIEASWGSVLELMWGMRNDSVSFILAGKERIELMWGMRND